MYKKENPLSSEKGVLENVKQYIKTHVEFPIES